MILDFEAIILSQLNIYYQETKRAPQKIIYYRYILTMFNVIQIKNFFYICIKKTIYIYIDMSYKQFNYKYRISEK